MAWELVAQCCKCGEQKPVCCGGSGDPDDIRDNYCRECCPWKDEHAGIHRAAEMAAIGSPAPDLLKALKLMVSRFDRTSSYGFVSKEDMATARAAIAKAEGR